MQSPILDGLALVDVTGRTILASTLASLLAAIACHGFLRARYAALERDARQSAERKPMSSIQCSGGSQSGRKAAPTAHANRIPRPSSSRASSRFQDVASGF